MANDYTIASENGSHGDKCKEEE